MRPRLLTRAVGFLLCSSSALAQETAQDADDAHAIERGRPGFRLITKAEPYGLNWTTAARLLGGVEATVFTGGARIRSSVVHETRGREPIASGNVSNDGWSITTYGAPEKSGMILEPRFGFLSQKMSISDFRADVPGFHLEGTELVPAVCRDAESAEVFACEHENQYDVHLKSFFLGANAGGALVAQAGRYWSLYLKGTVGANLFEHRTLTSTIADHTQTNSEAFLGRGAGAAINVGAKLLPAHLAFRVGGTYDYYFDFDYGDAIEFYGPTEFSEDLQTYRRPVVEVEKASLHAWALTFGLALTIF